MAMQDVDCKHSHLHANSKLACAVLLIVSSIVLAFYQTVSDHDIANGVLMYIAQAFLLAGSLFGIDYYIHKLHFDGREISSGNPQQ